MNTTLTAISVVDIWAGAVKLNTSAQRGSQKVLVGFDPTTFLLAGGCLTTRLPGLDNLLDHLRCINKHHLNFTVSLNDSFELFCISFSVNYVTLNK